VTEHSDLISELVVFWVAFLPLSSLNPEDGGSTVLRNVVTQPPHYTVQQKPMNPVFTAVKASNLAKHIMFLIS